MPNGYQRNKGAREIQLHEASLTFGPAVQDYTALLATPDEAKRHGQVRLVIGEKKLYWWDANNMFWNEFAPRELEGIRKIDVADIDDPIELLPVRPSRNREIVAVSDGSSARLYFWAIGQRPISVAYPFVVSQDVSEGSWVSFDGASSAVSHFSMIDQSNSGLIYEGSADPGVVIDGRFQLENDVSFAVPMTPAGFVPVVHNSVEYQIMLWEPEPVERNEADVSSMDIEMFNFFRTV